MTSPIVDQHFVVLGLARQGLAVTRWFREQGAQVTVSDTKPEAELQSSIDSLRDLEVKFVLGGHPLSLLNDCDALMLPSVGKAAPVVAVSTARVTTTEVSLRFPEVSCAAKVNVLSPYCNCTPNATQVALIPFPLRVAKPEHIAKGYLEGCL